MKKTCPLALLSVCCLTATAQISSLDELSTEKAYTIYNPYYTTYAVHNAQKSNSLVWAAGMTASDRNIADDSYKTALDASDPSSSWMIPTQALMKSCERRSPKRSPRL